MADHEDRKGSETVIILDILQVRKINRESVLDYKSPMSYEKTTRKENSRSPRTGHHPSQFESCSVPTKTGSFHGEGTLHSRLNPRRPDARAFSPYTIQYRRSAECNFSNMARASSEVSSGSPSSENIPTRSISPEEMGFRVKDLAVKTATWSLRQEGR